MNVANACILAAFILIYAPRMVVARAMAKQPEGYDNADPRAQQARLAGLGKRALAAHHNGFEAFAPFAAGVLAARQAGASDAVLVPACLVFVAARIAYVACYLADQAALRSLVWFVGFCATIALFFAAVA